MISLLLFIFTTFYITNLGTWLLFSAQLGLQSDDCLPISIRDLFFFFTAFLFHLYDPIPAILTVNSDAVDRPKISV